MNRNVWFGKQAILMCGQMCGQMCLCLTTWRNILSLYMPDPIEWQTVIVGLIEIIIVSRFWSWSSLTGANTDLLACPSRSNSTPHFRSWHRPFHFPEACSIIPPDGLMAFHSGNWQVHAGYFQFAGIHLEAGKYIYAECVDNNGSEQKCPQKLKEGTLNCDTGWMAHFVTRTIRSTGRKKAIPSKYYPQ